MRTVPQPFLFPMIGVILGLATTAGATTVASESKKGVAEAYAAIDTSSCTILAFGGKRATGASASLCGGGIALVTFTGKFPTDITPNNVIVNSSAGSSAFDITNDLVLTANPTTIEIDVSDWKSDTLAGQSNVNWITVFVGR
jgi:hypothetical protein